MTTVLTETRPISKSIYEESCRVIPSGVNSPVRSFPGLDETPLVASHAKGSMLYDADGKAYCDFCGSWGALLFGHAHDRVVKAVQERIAKGSSFGITTEIEAKLAKKITELVPSVEKVRFVSSGTEATMSATRLARGYTGRDLVIKFNGHYHGSADIFLIQAGSGVANLSPTSSSAGVPADVVKQTVSLPFNQKEEVQAYIKEHAHRLAAVIVEPIAGNMGVVPATQEFMRMLREETAKVGALLIFDEVMTGFRVGPQGAQGVYPVKPDLTCFGKIVGGGFPAAAFGGRAEIMDYLAPNGPVYQAGTLSGNPVAMEAGYQTLSMIQEMQPHADLEEKTTRLVHSLQKALREAKLTACVQQMGSMFTVFWGRSEVRHFEDAKELDVDLFGDMFSFLLQKGIYFPPSQYEACFVSTEHTQEQLDAVRDALVEFIHMQRNA